MSVDRIDSLHQKASEHYLSGEYPDAIAAWQAILAIDPGNEQALEGVRMSQLLSEGASFSLSGDAGQAPGPAPAAVQRADAPTGNETVILDGAWLEAEIASQPPVMDVAPPKIGDLDPARQGEGIDFGDLSAIPSIAPVAPSTDPVEERVDALFGEDGTDPAAAFEPEAVGLAPAEPRRKPQPAGAPTAPPGPSAAALELKRRVDDLLREAREKAEAGERDEAMAVLSRVFILDEENPEALAVEAELRSESERDLGNIELWLTEGVQALEAGRLDEAESRFQMVLDRSPDHREAKHFMEEVRERRTATPAQNPEEDLLAVGGGFGSRKDGMTPESPSAKGPSTFSADPSAEAVPLAARPGAPAGRDAAAGAPWTKSTIPVGRSAAVAETGPKKQGRRLPLPSLKTLGLAAGLVVVVAGGYYGYELVLGGSRPSATITPAQAPPARPSRPAKVAPPSGTTGAPAAPGTAAPKTVNEALARASSAMASSDYGAAVLAYNAALKIDGGNAEARDGLARAAEGFKAQKAVQDQLDRIRMAFRDGEYSSALRMLYRMPPGADPAKIERYKVNGWYNIGIVSLRAGECREAIGSFDEALGIAPDEKDTKLLKEFATRYLSANHDRGFYDKVEALKFREMTD